MDKKYLEAGIIANTHGVRGAVRVHPWADNAEFLLDFDRFVIDGKEFKVLSSSVHKTALLCTLEGIDTIEAAIRMKNKTVYIYREDVQLEPGRFFVSDLVGLEVRDKNLGVLGKITDVLNLPASDVYIVRGEKSYAIPKVDAFVKEVNPTGGFVMTEIIEGMEYEG